MTATVPGATGPSDVEPTPEVRSWAWHLMQVSAWLLAIMVPIHLISMWFGPDPAHFGVATFVDRWHSAEWRVFDWAFLVLALGHGGMGLDHVLGSLVRRPGARTAVSAAIAVVLITLGLIATSAIFSFDV